MARCYAKYIASSSHDSGDTRLNARLSPCKEIDPVISS